jgi:hypothetical protein
VVPYFLNIRKRRGVWLYYKGVASINKLSESTTVDSGEVDEFLLPLKRQESFFVCLENGKPSLFRM